MAIPHPIDAPALRLEGGYAEIDLQPNPVALHGAFRVEFWVRPDRIPRPGFVSLLALGLDGSNKGQTVYFWIGILNGEVAFGFSPGGACSGPPFPLEEKKWCHVSVGCVDTRPTLDATLYPVGKTYENRRLNCSFPSNTAGGIVGASTIRIGSFSTTDPRRAGTDSNAAFADLRLWSMPGSTANATSRLVGNEYGLEGYWMLDEAEGEAVYDSAARNNNGIIVRGYGWESATGLELQIGLVGPGLNDYVAVKQKQPLEARRDALDRGLAALVSRQTELERELGRQRELQQEAERGVEAQKKENEGALEKKQQAFEARRGEIARVEEQELRKKEGSNSVRLGEFIGHVQKDLENSRSRINSEYGRVTGLDRFEMDIKMVPGFGGVGLRLPDPQKQTDAGRLSTLTLAFRARPDEERKAPEHVRVPNLEGTTEIFARRKLTEAGFKVDAAYQVVTELSGQHGRVLKLVYGEIEPGKATLGSLIGLVVGRAR